MNDTTNPTDSANAAEASPLKDRIIEALKTIDDPELFLDIWFLGLIYNIGIDDTDPQRAEVAIDMTFTSPMCPAGPELRHAVITKVGELEGVEKVSVNITFQPPWEPSDEVKGLLGMM
jgi:metal-sulfur cluster biosynthetic enzyme